MNSNIYFSNSNGRSGQEKVMDGFDSTSAVVESSETAYNAGNMPLKALPKIDLAEVCRTIRKDCGYTQQELALLLDVAKSAIEKWESGKHEPSGQAIAQLYKLRESNRRKRA